MKSALKGLAHRFWAVPLLFAITASLLALGVTALDESLDTSLRLPFQFAGGPEGTRALLERRSSRRLVAPRCLGQPDPEQRCGFNLEPVESDGVVYADGERVLLR